MMPVRSEFLNSFWEPYPPADSEACLDPAVFVESKVFIAGRIQNLQKDDLQINLNGKVVDLAGLKGATWDPSGLRGGVSLSLVCRNHLPSHVLQLNDQVGFFCVKSEIDKSWQIERVILFSPALASYELPSAEFDYSRSRLWYEYLTKVREFFSSRDFTEVNTPTLVPSPGTEPFLDAFATDFESGQVSRRFFLPTSPEFHLKKLLAKGWTRIFEMRPCFRNGEISEHHQPEFWMLEWYRGFSNLEKISDDVESLLKTVSPGEITIEKQTMAEVFRSYVDFELTPQTTRDELCQLAFAQGVAFAKDDSWNDLFFRIFIEKIERKLGQSQPLILSKYPPSQSALARIDKNGWADRFEVYWRGLELGNAFHELNDPKENLARFRQDLEEKRKLNRALVPIDADLLRALEFGMPPSGGIAMGLERIFMAAYRIGAIGETRPFPILS